MKKTLLAITGFLVYVSIQAQNLYGTTLEGGNNGGGVINEFVGTNTNDLLVTQSFENIAANPYYTNFIQASDGKLYGMTYGGGSSDVGVIFSFDPLTSVYKKVRDFEATTGGNPFGSLVQASDGKLYGMTAYGGNSGSGVIFSFDPLTSIYTKLKDFDYDNDGGNPYGSLLQASDGKLYGMTYGGGGYNSGVIFSFDPSSSTYTKVKEFDLTSGGNPYGSLIEGSDGKLYGMTTYGGAPGSGVIFSLDLSSSTYVDLKEFDYYTNGGDPFGSLIQASDGKLYGMTAYGGSSDVGTIFSFDPVASAYTKLEDFDYTNGSNPYGSLVQAADGKLYGLTGIFNVNGGGYGVIFSFDYSSSTFTKLKDFDYIDGAYPMGSLMQASDGKLYGMTNNGGASIKSVGGYGVIFSFDPAASAYTKLKDIASNENGSNVSGSLLKYGDGMLYGMTTNGGSNGAGIIFSFDASTFVFTKLKDLDYVNGANPYGSLMRASDGKLYGMTFSGGSSGNGVIFSFDRSSGTYIKLKDFDSTGGKPYGSLMQATDGKLYGITSSGGTSNYGIIFSFDPATGTYTKLKDFDYFNDGGYAYGSLVQASDGKLYGLSGNGGSDGFGVIFSFDPLSSTYTTLLNFDNYSGANPMASLIQAGNGKLYGLTGGGGGRFRGGGGYGILFSFDPLPATYTALYIFDDTTGATPVCNLLQAGNGKLYGMTSAGGSSDLGVVFSFDPLASTYTQLVDYNGVNGAVPPVGAGFIEVPEAGPLPVALISFTGKNNGNSNLLSWEDVNERNLDYYELQRSIDGQNFKGSAQIKATGNNVYVYNDPIVAPISFIYYYRLKSVDRDGNFKYSAVIKLRVNAKGFAVVNPNPFKNKLVVTVESLTRDKATFIMTDLSGQQLYKQNKLVIPGTNVIEIDETGRFSKGTYLLTIIESQQSQTIKVIKGN